VRLDTDGFLRHEFRPLPDHAAEQGQQNLGRSSYFVTVVREQST
jgi:hypothetical protein